MIKRKIVSEYDACVYGWETGDFTEAENLEELNKAVFREFFAGLVLGVYDAVVIRDGKFSAHVFTRSSRAGVPVQETVFSFIRGAWSAGYHKNVYHGSDNDAGAGNVYIYESGEDMPELEEIAA